MAVSPRSELRIVSITEFSREGEGDDAPWQFEQQDANAEVVLRGGGFGSLDGAVNAFFEEVGYDPDIVKTDDTKAHFSEPIRVGDDRYHIRQYAYGAPKPFMAAQ